MNFRMQATIATLDSLPFEAKKRGQESLAEWVREIFLEKFRNATQRTLTHYGFISDVELSSTLRILDRLPPSQWLSDDQWHAVEAVDFLKQLSNSQLSNNSERKLSQADQDSLKRILAKLPPPFRHEEPSSDS